MKLQDSHLAKLCHVCQSYSVFMTDFSLSVHLSCSAGLSTIGFLLTLQQSRTKTDLSDLTCRDFALYVGHLRLVRVAPCYSPIFMFSQLFPVSAFISLHYIHFCPSLNVFTYISFWTGNTVSNLIMILPPICGAIQTFRDGLELRYICSFLGLAG